MKKTYTKKAKIDTFQIVTDRIIELLEKGTVPWQKPWKLSATGQGMARNIVTGKAYRGVNILILGCAGYASNLFMTYNQAKKLGGNVKRGEKGFPVVYWKFLEKEEMDDNNQPTGKIKRIPMLRHYTVFALEQTENVKVPKKFTSIDDDESPEDFNGIECCESIIENWNEKPEIRHAKQDQAFYSPSYDYVSMPQPEQFNSPEEYYSTLFHELGHSTGHHSRLDRAFGKSFGDDLYSKEELTAEFCAAMVCGHCEIDTSQTIQNSAAYVKSWIKALKNDKKLIVMGSSRGEKAARMILGLDNEIKED